MTEARDTQWPTYYYKYTLASYFLPGQCRRNVGCGAIPDPLQRCE